MIGPHATTLHAICAPMTLGRTELSYVSEAIAVAERENCPRIGLAVTRRVLRGLCKRYNDATIYAATCFICAQVRTSIEGYEAINLQNAFGTKDLRLLPRRELVWLSADDFRAIERHSLGTL